MRCRPQEDRTDLEGGGGGGGDLEKFVWKSKTSPTTFFAGMKKNSLQEDDTGKKKETFSQTTIQKKDIVCFGIIFIPQLPKNNGPPH